VTSSNYVGIGNSSPSYKLHVDGYIGLHEGLIFTRENWNYICVPATDGNLSFNVGDAGTARTKMCIKNDGKVGIGTTSPSYKLDVNGDICSNGFHHLSHDNNDSVLLAGGSYVGLSELSSSHNHGTSKSIWG
jgi:archaellum component FlaG (FlaF/FlaG flagellin family)